MSERLEAAEAAAALLKEELTETRQAVSWREEELAKMRKANADSEVPRSLLKFQIMPRSSTPVMLEGDMATWNETKRAL